MRRSFRKAPRPRVAGDSAAEADARDLLGIGANADAAAIQAAWRLRMAQVHPDAGGSDAAAAAVTAARDLLLARNRRRPKS
jgi:curved DNA-binding protein CbpA